MFRLDLPGTFTKEVGILGLDNTGFILVMAGAAIPDDTEDCKELEPLIGSLSPVGIWPFSRGRRDGVGVGLQPESVRVVARWDWNREFGSTMEDTLGRGISSSSWVPPTSPPMPLLSSRKSN